MSPRVLLESSRGQFWENCRNRVRGRFWRNRQTFPRDVSGTPAKPDVATCPTSRRNPSAFVIQTPSPSPSDLANIDASQPLVFPELSTNSTPTRLGARSGSQRGPVVAQASGPPFSTARLSGQASNATARSPASAWSSSSHHRNAAAWYIGTRHALVKTDSLQPRHPCTCTPQTKNWRNLHRVATTHS